VSLSNGDIIQLPKFVEEDTLLFSKADRLLSLRKKIKRLTYIKFLTMQSPWMQKKKKNFEKIIQLNILANTACSSVHWDKFTHSLMVIIKRNKKTVQQRGCRNTQLYKLQS
jgi:hypothetical protein